MNHLRHQLASATARLALIIGGVLLPAALCAAGGDAPAVLVHRFTIDEPHEWVLIELRPTAALWHQRITGGPTARFEDVRAVLGSLQGIAIGARCPGRTEESVHYPCVFDVDVGSGDVLESWISTTTYKLMQPGEGIVSAISTPRPEQGSITVAGEAALTALIAPAALVADLAQDRPLYLRVRVRPPPVPDDGRNAGTAGNARARPAPTQGVIVISTQPLRSKPPSASSDSGSSV
jgi:hypothetical protein